MDKVISQLQAWGCMLDDILDIFQGDEEAYLNLVASAGQDPALLALGEALKKREAHEAFEQAHMLKGVFGNLGLTPLYDILSSLVEPLRHGSLDGVDAHYADLMKNIERLNKIFTN